MTVDEPEPVSSPPPIPVVAATATAAQVINFHNGTAVRIALGMAAVSFCSVLITFPVAADFAILWLVVAGFLAVFLYRQRTGQRLSTSGGARLGWICGIFVFLILAVMIAITAAWLSDPGAVAKMREQLNALKQPAASIDQAIDAFKHPGQVLVGLLQMFLLLTILPAFGGAVGAKLLNRD
jgi:heme/copper-type cytochrome/quinol oxidase subunit 2